MKQSSPAHSQSDSPSVLGAWITQSVRRHGWVPIGFFAAHVVATKAFEAYLHLPWLDIPMHFFGGVAIAYFFACSLTSPLAFQVLGRTTGFGSRLLIFAGTCSSTVVWEFAEWCTDALGITQAQLGLEDTLLDMLLGVLGGLLLILVKDPQAAEDS